MPAPFELFQGRKLPDGDRVVTNVRRQTILKTSLRSFGWGPDAALSDRQELASTLLYHSGLSPIACAAEAMAVAVVRHFPADEWAITAAQVHDWYDEYLTLGGFNGEGNDRPGGRRASRDQ